MRILLLMILPSVVGAQSTYFSPLPLGHWSYSYLEILVERGHLSNLPKSVRPWNRFDVATGLKTMQTAHLVTFEKDWLKLLLIEFSSEIAFQDESRFRLGVDANTELERGYSDTKSFFRLEPQAEYILPTFSGVARGRIDSRLKDDPLYQGRKTDFFGARMEDAMGMAHSKYLFIYIGRTAESWGPFGTQSLILSANPLTYDKLGFGFRGKRFAFRSVFAGLDDIQGAKRFFSAHRLDWQISESLNLGISESVIYGGPAADWELAYSNPFTIFANAQLNDKKEANENLAFDLRWTHPRVTIRMQLLIDDFVLDGASAPPPNRETSPDRLASKISVSFQDIFVSASRIELGYQRVGSYTYNVKSKRPWQSYTYQSLGLGAETNDGDRFTFQWDYYGFSGWFLRSKFDVNRKGERTLLTNDFDDSTFVKLPFPSGSSSKTLSFSQSGRFQISANYYAEGEIAVSKISNYGFVKGSDKKIFTFRTGFTYVFRHDLYQL